MRKSIGPDVKNLMKILLQNASSYFSHDCLNSEGRKLFEEMARMLVYEHPEYKPIIQKTRRNPTFANVLKVAEKVLGKKAGELLSW